LHYHTQTKTHSLIHLIYIIDIQEEEKDKA